MIRTRLFAVPALSFLFSFGLSIGAQAGEVIDSIRAIVNDGIVTRSDVQDFERRLKTGGLVDDQLVPDEATKKSLLGSQELMLKKVIDARILDTQVKKENLTIPFERVEQEIRSIARRNNMQRDDLKRALEEKGVSFSQYQDFIKTGLERQQLVEKSVTSKIKISEDDVLAALLAQGLTSDSQAFEYSISRILFLDAKRGKEAAKNRAQEATTLLKEGTAWDRVAADYSDDPDFEIGGVVGTPVVSNELPKRLETEIAKLSPGEWTPPVPMDGGWQIVRMTKRRLIPNPVIEEKSGAVRAQLGEKAFRRQYDIWLEQLRAEAFIHINAM